MGKGGKFEREMEKGRRKRMTEREKGGGVIHRKSKREKRRREKIICRQNEGERGSGETDE